MNRCRNKGARYNQHVEQEKEDVGPRQRECPTRRKRLGQALHGSVDADEHGDGENQDRRQIQAAGQGEGGKGTDHQQMARDLEIPPHIFVLLPQRQTNRSIRRTCPRWFGCGRDLYQSKIVQD